MKKYNVNVDRQKPSSEEILSRRDFDGLMKQYNAAPGKIIQKPFYKTGWFYGSLATAAAVTIAVVVYVSKSDVSSGDKSVTPIVNIQNNKNSDSVSNKNNSNNNTSVVAQFVKQKISPPLKNLDVAFTNYKINSTHGGIITHNSGSKITIPANAFVDASGNPVKGNVEIKYREFRDQVDIFLAGIPMQYDSAGVSYPFESAGMMEIGAFVDGKVVYLDKNKQVQVEFAAKGSDKNFNMYKFDTVAGNWSYMGKDNVVAMPVKKDSVNPIAGNSFHGPGCGGVKDDVLTKPEEPTKPLKADKHKNRFVVAVDPKEFPGMVDYQNVLFEVDETRTKFDPSYYKTTWESIVASRGNEKDRDVLTLVKGKQMVTLSVYPVLDGKKYDDAMADYNKKYADYQTALEKYNQQVDQIAQSHVNQAMANNNSNNNSKFAKANNDKAVDVMHVFVVSSFGIYNCDGCGVIPDPATVDLTVKEKGGNIFSDFAIMYHVDCSINALFSYNNENPLNSFHFNANSKNLIWAVKDGVLYYANEAMLATLPTSGPGSIQLDACEKDFKSPTEMKKFFHIGQ